MEEKGICRGRIAVDSFPSKFEGWVKPHLPDLEVVDASKLLREMRLIKDEYELDLIRNPGDISDWAQDKMKEAIRPGKTPVEIETEVAHMIAAGAARRYPSGASIRPNARFTGIGPEGAMPHD